MTVRHVLGGLANGAVVSVMAIASSVSCAAFLFSGSLAAGLGFGVAISMLSLAVGVVFSLRSGLRFTTAGPDATLTAVLAVGFAPVVAASGARAVPTVLAGVTLTTAFVGLLLFGIGRAHAARIVRYLPYPMIGGFSAASGLIALFGGVRMLAIVPLNLATLPAVLLSVHGIEIAAGLLFAGVLIVTTRRWGPIAMPAAIAAVLVVVGIVEVVLRLPFAELQSAGWFLRVPPGGIALIWTHAADVDWQALAAAWPMLFAVGLIALTTQLLNTTGLELLARRDIDLDADLRVAGVTNVLGSFVGAMATLQTVSRSSLNYRLGTRDRLPGIVVALIGCALAVFGSGPIISRLPTLIPASLLIYTGFVTAQRWLVAERRRLAFVDFATVWAIVVLAVAFGFVVALVGGIVLCCVTFAVRYSRIDAIERRHSAATYHSSLQRSQREMDVLTSYGENAHIYRLRGYVFFGMADPIHRELLERIATVIGPAWIIVDFAGVTGMDSSVAAAFQKVLHAVDAENVQVFFSGMRPDIAALWNALGDGDTHALMFDDLDLAVEWCESEVLHLFDSYTDVAPGFSTWIAHEVGEDLAPILLAQLERVEIDTGEALFLAGDEGGRMFFIESGRVAVIAGEESPRRIRSLGPQTIVGEVGLYRHVPHESSAIAESPTVAHVLTRDALDIVEMTDPHLTTWFHAAIVRTLADRLAYQTGVAGQRV
jgi:SulP family sulfate permease